MSKEKEGDREERVRERDVRKDKKVGIERVAGVSLLPSQLAPA